MALLDRFRTQPRHNHPDPAVRLTHVEDLPIDDRDQLASIARDDEDPRVRRAAVAKLIDPPALAGMARDDRDQGVREQAVEMLRDIALEAFEGVGEFESLAAVDALTDTKALALVAKSGRREMVARRALSRISDARTIGSIARHGVLEPVRRVALDRLQDHDEIVAVAMHGEFKETAVAAVGRLSERAELAQVAARAINKAAAKRARAILREMDDRAAAGAATTSPAPDAAEVARGDRLKILRRLETLLAVGDVQAAEVAWQRAEAAWASVAGVPEPALAARFAAAEALVHARLSEARAIAAEQERLQAEAAERRAEEQAAQRRLADAAADKEAARRRARLAELADEAESAANDADLVSANRRLQVARREWGDLSVLTAADPEVATRFAEAEARLATREAETRADDARRRREALTGLRQLIACVAPLLRQADLSFKAADHALRDVRAALANIPPLPSRRDYDDITRQLKAVHVALTPKVLELREAEQWRRFANLAVQEQLCAKMEALRALDDPEAIARHVRDFQQQWRQAADVPRAQAESLWRRFKAAHDEVWPRCEAYFAAQAEARAANLARKIALTERVEALADSTNWIQTADEIKRLQAEWKTIGPATHGQEKAVWDRFRGACDRFFTGRQQDLARRKAIWADNLAKKEALAVKAEALAESTDWETAVVEIKRLQAEWRTIGPVKKTRSEAIWQRFRGACDRFFTRYAERHDTARAERIAAREAICVELETLAPAGPQASDVGPPPVDVLASVRAVRARWQQEVAARGVDRERAEALERRFQTAFDRVIAHWPGVFMGTDLDPDANRRRMEALVARIEELAASVTQGAAPGTPGNDAALSPATRLAAMLKEALAANTIGGKVDVESRWRAAQEDVRQAQASWARIGPVSEDIRRTLSDRFQRACRRITGAAGGAGGAGGAGRAGGSGRAGGAGGAGRAGGAGGPGN